MAGINKNFVVKNGLEVASNLIIADDLTNSVGIATTVTAHTLHVNGGIGATDVLVTGIITAGNLSVQGAVSFNDFSAITANISTLNATTLIYTPGIGSFSQLNIGTGGTSLKVTDAGFVGIGTTNPNSLLSVIGNVGVTGVVTTRNLSATGVGTITNINSTNLTGTAATITTLSSTTINADNGYIVTGVTTNFTTTNATATNLTGTAATITTLKTTTENVGTLNAVSGVVTSISGTNLVYSGVSTFTNGPVLIGSGTSTGTLDQDLQVTGSAYVSGNLGLGLTNPTNKLDVSGNANITGTLNAVSFTGNVSAGVGTIANVNGTNITGTAGTITTLNSTTGNITTLRSTTANATTGYIVTGVTTNFTTTNATATNLTGTAATITTLRSTTANATTGYIVTGVTTNFTTTNATATNLTGTAATITTLSSTNGSITNITGTAATITTLRSNTSVTTDTLNAVTGVVTTISGLNASYTNINTTHVNATGIVTASSFVGNGSGITGITAVPGGSDKQIQYNDAGLTNGAAQLFYDDSTNRIGLGSTVPATSLDLYGNATTQALYVRNTERPQAYVLSGVSAGNFGRLGYYDGSVFGTLAINDGGGNVAISTNVLTGTASQGLQVNSGAYFNGKVGIANTNPAGGLEISTAGSSSAAQLTLSGSTSNWINLSATGVAAPAFTTRSAGTKLVLYNTLSASKVDFGFGIESATLWSSVENTSGSFKWYGGTTLAATLTGGGNFSASGSITGNTIVKSGGTSSQFLKADGSVDSNAYITSASVGNGTLTLNVSGTGLSGSQSFTANQSGNATFTVTSNATSANTASTIVARDASGNFTAGTITANLTGNVTGNLTGNITNTVTGTNTTELVRGNMADNDQFRILIGGTATNAGYVEIATADDGTEPIYVRQYTGTFSSLTRTATLLDGSGNTSFPGSITASSIVKSGGTSSQFLKADGSVDSNAYITSASVGNGTLTLNVSGTGLSGSQSFTANQSGNATFTVTSNATSSGTTADTIISRGTNGDFTAGTANLTRIACTSSSSTAGINIMTLSDSTRECLRVSEGGTVDNPNLAGAILYVRKTLASGRSINASGTINASGADYAEYMYKDGDFTINKGDICGITTTGLLTNVYNNAISFAVKSSDPSYVGGDTWHEQISIPYPERKDFDNEEDYLTQKALYDVELEEVRQRVDRIAFAGQVPVNVYGATPGQYIVPVVKRGGKIDGVAKNETDLTLSEYMKSIGKVIAIEEDGRARIIVKVA